MPESQLPESSAAANSGRSFTFPVDRIGVWTSTLCVIHCLLIPVVLSLSAVSAHFLPSEERTIVLLQSQLPRLEPMGW
jgi:hypothetical protein